MKQKVSERKQSEFLKWFQPTLDALKELGGSGKPREVSNKIAEDLKLSNQVLSEVTKVELVDGEKIVQMFEKVQLGVKPKNIYEVDLTFFEPYFQR